MTAPRRLVPLKQVEELFDFLERRGIDVRQCGVDIGADYVKVLPPANSNAGDTLGNLINRTPHRPKAAEKR